MRQIALVLEALRRELAHEALHSTGERARRLERAAGRLDAALEDLVPELVREDGACLSR